MANFELVSIESFPEDKYIKEVAYVAVNGGYRLGYIHKLMQNGGSFWDVMGCSVTQGGEKQFMKGVKFQDNFLQEDIKEFLQKRKWESGRSIAPRSMDEVADERLPF